MMANGEYSIIIYFSLFYRVTWVQRCWPRATPEFGSASVISSFLLQDIPRHPDSRLFEVREAFKSSLLVFRRIFEHISHFFRAQQTPNYQFERSENLVDTSRKKKYVRVACALANLGLKGVVKTLLLSHATTGGVQKGSVNALS